MEFKEVNEVPARKKNQSEYMELVNRFMDSGMPIAMISDLDKGKNAANVAANISNIGYKMYNQFRVSRRGRDIYLINTDLYKGD